jgi:hypothetical protein
MRFRLGRVPSTPGFHPEQGGWRRLREPGPLLMQVLALPVAGVVFVVLGAVAVLLGMAHFREVHPAAYLLILVGIIPVHEGLHVLAHPEQGRSPDSIVGFWPKTLLFYAHYDQVLTRNRMLLILLLPFLVLSVVPLAVCGLLGWHWSWVGVLSVWNGLLSCGDLFGVMIVAWQVPQAARVRNQGYRTWWTTEEAAARQTGEADRLPDEADRPEGA